MNSTGSERLHKRIANAGVCSRRAAEKLIAEGRVEVNGHIVSEMGHLVTPEDEVKVDSKKLPEHRHLTLLMNKPVGYITTMNDPFSRKTVTELLPAMDVVLKPVGRLDKETSGLLLFTNDGQLAMRLTHPRHAIEKEYQVTVAGEPGQKELDRLRKGVYIPGGKTGPSQVTSDSRRPDQITIVIHEGRYRQVRLMFEAIGHPVNSLKRIRIGSLRMRGLPVGACRMLSKVEVDSLRQAVGLDPS